MVIVSVNKSIVYHLAQAVGQHFLRYSVQASQHSHKNNEEIYGILSGKGKAVIDGEEIELATGDWLKVSPAAKRQFFAANDSGLMYVCIQVKENSLECFTADDAVILS